MIMISENERRGKIRKKLEGKTLEELEKIKKETRDSNIRTMSHLLAEQCRPSAHYYSSQIRKSIKRLGHYISAANHVIAQTPWKEIPSPLQDLLKNAHLIDELKDGLHGFLEDLCESEFEEDDA